MTTTPGPFIVRMLEILELKPGMRVLEPSAGTGSFVGQALSLGCEVVAFETDKEVAARLLKDLRPHPGKWSVIDADFLTAVPDQSYDRVWMAPPTDVGADLDHVMHAMDFLKPGGVLVALLPRERAARNRKKEPTHIPALEGFDHAVESVPELDREIEDREYPASIIVTVQAPAA